MEWLGFAPLIICNSAAIRRATFSNSIVVNEFFFGFLLHCLRFGIVYVLSGVCVFVCVCGAVAFRDSFSSSIGIF